MASPLTPRGDYSLGAHASGVRDLLTAPSGARCTRCCERPRSRQLGDLLRRVRLAPGGDIDVLAQGFSSPRRTRRCLAAASRSSPARATYRTTPTPTASRPC